MSTKFGNLIIDIVSFYKTSVHVHVAKQLELSSSDSKVQIQQEVRSSQNLKDNSMAGAQSDMNDILLERL